jgi:protease I
MNMTVPGVSMPGPLTGRRVAVLIAKGVEQVELFVPHEALEDAGATAHIVSREAHTVRGWNRSAVDRQLGQARADDYDPCCYQAA